mmetsp:Transcript_8139/g.19407  ORF Transcript_8139/g.19407 Transcript_8139/m.19407 type:complete len:378 (-) Transcript_8139:6017-7150(-)
MVVLAGVLDAETVLHRGIVLLAHEVVVPEGVVWHHEEAQEDITQQHLHLLRVGGQETRRVGACVLVRLTPLEALGRNAVGCQRAAAWREAAGNDDRLVSQPRLVVCQHSGMEGHVLRTQVRLLVRLRVDPAQWLQVTQVIMVGQLLRQRHIAVRANLRHHDHAPNLLHLGVVRRRNAIEVGGDLRAQVTDANEGLQDVLRHDIRVASLPNVFTVDIQVVRPQVQRRRADGTNAPLRARGEGLLLVGGACCHDHLLTVHVGGLGGNGCDLRHLLALLLKIGDLLSLDGWRCDLHSEDDVANLTLGKRSNVDIVLLSVVCQDQVLELHLNVDPLVVGETRPHVVWLGDCRLVGLQDDLCAIRIHVQRPQDQDHSTEGSV